MCGLKWAINIINKSVWNYFFGLKFDQRKKKKNPDFGFCPLAQKEKGIT